MLEIFQYGEQQIRTAGDAESPLFAGMDVCKVLELNNSRQALATLDEDEKGVITADTLGGEQKLGAVTEAGLYKLIFRSRKDGAKAFQRWVTHEVLPQIRKTGKYSVDTEHQQKLREIETNQLKEQALQLAYQSQLSALQAAKGLVHPDHLEAKARIVLARSMHEAPELDPSTRPLYTTDFLKGKNLSREQMKKAGQFGKEVKKAYKTEHGVEPQKSPMTLPNGQVRDVLAYTEADRPLFERVFREYFGQFLALK